MGIIEVIDAIGHQGAGNSLQSLMVDPEPGQSKRNRMVNGTPMYHHQAVPKTLMSTNTMKKRSSRMRGTPVDCVVKSPVALQLGDVVSDSVRPGVYITDVVLAEPLSIQEISFKNYYTAYLTVRVLKNEEASDESSAKWFTCVRNYPLMSSPHTEGGSQDYFSIYRQQHLLRFVLDLRNGVKMPTFKPIFIFWERVKPTANLMLTEPDNVITVRLILRQPSSVWLNFSIEDIKIYSLADEESERDIPSWLSTITPAEEPLDLNASIFLERAGLPDPDTVSSSIQQMWALTEIMQSSQTSASIGRFDVDGCYDINLLSYT
ncbi:nicolin-1 [Silurus asotus]|uniref:Nicolin-1 n=1 Tax=Silurus asotus TaxID=30991 RepID=A0AAD5A139_SILAS|nr:nicolin-1 [Silurus asotus]